LKHSAEQTAADSQRPTIANVMPEAMLFEVLLMLRDVPSIAELQRHVGHTLVSAEGDTSTGCCKPTVACQS
jgi:hypothetical protein